MPRPFDSIYFGETNGVCCSVCVATEQPTGRRPRTDPGNPWPQSGPLQVGSGPVKSPGSPYFRKRHTHGFTIYDVIGTFIFMLCLFHVFLVFTGVTPVSHRLMPLLRRPRAPSHAEE